MLEDEFTEPYKAWKAAPGPATMTPLLKSLNPVIDSAMRTYAGKGSPTLRSRAKLIMADAINKYDPSRGKLRTHLMYNLQGLRRANAQENQIITLPERVAIDLYHLKQHEGNLRDELGRDPSMNELADRSGLSRRRISYINKSQPGLPEGMLSSEGNAGEEQVALGPAVQQADAERVWHEYIYHDLQPADQIIMEHTLGLFGKPTLPKKQIAVMLGISSGAVTQRAAKIQEKIDRREELSPMT
jgi:DNA-directed RNA polymerase specialized sigma subunit